MTASLSFFPPLSPSANYMLTSDFFNLHLNSTKKAEIASTKKEQFWPETLAVNFQGPRVPVKAAAH